ncbi:hypothetical protein [Leifsonia xyli]|uniref:hypothetical protein n=1 Tax=Leifsonia xyli TaxID=1575 RepID=UPI003D67D27E
MAEAPSRAAPKIALTLLLLGLGGLIYGILTSLANASPDWAIASKIIGIGWSWAALGIVASAVVPRMPIRGALVCLLCAVVAYYLADGARGLYTAADAGTGSSSIAWGVLAAEMAPWAVAAVVLGIPLALIGAALRRPDMLGLLSRLAIPVGAAVEYFVLRLPAELVDQNEVLITTCVALGTTGTVCAIAIVVRAAARGELRWPGTRASRPDPSAG